MKIAIEALGIHYFGGGRSATLNLLKALFTYDTRNQYLVFLTQPENELDFAAGRVQQFIAPVKQRMAVRAWAQLQLPLLTRGFDLVHFMKNLGVFGVNTRTITTVYDLTTLIYPDLFPRFDVWYWRNIEGYTLNQSSRIISISKNTADDLVNFYHIDPMKIDVIYPAHSANFVPATGAVIDNVRRGYRLPDRYILHAGRIDRKKNLSQLVNAFHALCKISDYPGKLVFVGEEYRKSADTELYATINRLGMANQVRFTGAVPDADMPAIISGADMAVMPSLHEGFGIAALEAMACGTPVIVNRAGAVGEVVGDAGIILDGRSTEDLTHALLLVFKQPELRKTLIQRSLAQASRFSWQRAAQATLTAYQHAVDYGTRDL